MQTKRTNNPRFLGALGFLGFLGFLGSGNPEVIRWARLSWLSLLALLTLLPTQNAATATYTLNPRRKWMLVLLGFLGFLWFLGSNTPMVAGLAGLSILSQLAIEPGKKKAAPVKELRQILTLLFFAVILPLGGMVWFMSAAVRNEQMAVRQRLTEVYESQLAAAFQGLEESIGRQRDALSDDAELPPALRFDALVRESIADSILVLDGSGKLVYPVNQIEAGFIASPEGLALQSEVRTLLRAGELSKACETAETMAADPALHNARDESGRLILPALQLFCLQGFSDTTPQEMATNADRRVSVLRHFKETVTDYSVAMSSARCLFYLQSLAQLGAEAEPWLGAETLAVELEELAVPSVANGYWPVPGKDLFLLFSNDRRTAAVFDGTNLLKRLQEQVGSLSTVEGVRLELEQGTTRAWRSRPFPMLGNDWHLGLHVEGDDPFSDTADQRILHYLWIGNLLILGMIVVFVLLVRSLLVQQRLTQMKNDFVATITHELKTPLASTRLLVDTLLAGDCLDATQQREYLELIARENKRLSRLIDNFLTFSRMERNKRTFNFADVAPAEIAEAATDAVRESYERSGCKLSLQVADGLPSIVADKDAMVTVLLNLLDNGCKYSESDKRIELKVFEKEQSVCFEVADHGIGLAKRELSKIMERFYQVDQSMTRKVGGAGLGLSIVKFIVEAHGGAIDIQSELGTGSAFTVKIPINGGVHGG